MEILRKMFTSPDRYYMSKTQDQRGETKRIVRSLNHIHTKLMFKLFPIVVDTRRRLVFGRRQDLQRVRPRPHHDTGRLCGRRNTAVAENRG